ncbi:MAG: sulfurtransferase TusA family protein [Nitrospiraceae bacterium]|nr:sulfurtransferase TusA family protein [Nitrospiraceae bacterium]
MSEVKSDMVLDTRGMSCPLPVLKTKRALEGLHEGQVLEVIASDRTVESDIAELLLRMGHELVGVRDDGPGVTFFIRKR